ncbi:MAG: hypothetical protein HY306_02010 [Nitrosomonadales bacterium]|nr:hypothetical protein [Nitrosomonadales bacterium]
MKHPMLTLCVTAIITATTVSNGYARTREVKPGVERWSIKTSVPAKAKNISASLADVLALPDPPGVSKRDSRYQSNRIPAFSNPLGVNEGDIITTTAWLYLVASENDGDYHIQVSGSAQSGDQCLIIEVPNENESFVSSAPLRQKVATVRAFIRDKLLQGREPSTSGSVMNHPVFVRISGQLFYDDAHVGDPPRGKKGMKAATLWELHPVTDITFATQPK